MEEEVAAVEDDEVVHKGPDKKGRVLWVMSQKALSEHALRKTQMKMISVYDYEM